MHDFAYSIAFRVYHPYLDPAVISEQLALQPKRAWKAGELRTTPKGAILEGKNRETYWSYSFEPDANLALSAYLAKIIARLEPHRAFLGEIRDQGGRLECFIGWFSGSNLGETFEYSLLSHFGSLQIDLSLDIYGNHELSVRVIDDIQ